MKRSIILTLYLLGVSVTGGCVKDETSRMATQGAGEQRIVLQLADTEEIQTYSAASVNERMIEDAYVLVFDNTGTYKNGNMVDAATGGIADNGTQTPTISVKVTPADGDMVVVLLNTGLSVNPLTSIPIGTRMEDINTLFLSSGWKFSQSGAHSGKGMPMSGEVVWSNTSPPVCQMHRSVAKIQVALAADLASNDITGKFTTAVDAVQWAVFNAPSKGNIYSVGGAMSIPTLSDADFYQEIGFPHRITTMTGVMAFEMNGYLPEYNSSTKAKTADVEMSAFAADRTCVILKVPEAGISGGDGYYRLDLVQGNKGYETKAYLDIQRNCHYTINISRVSSKGYDTAAEALAAPSSNVEYEISDNANNILGNGQYAVVVDKDPIEVLSDMGTPQNLIRVGLRGNVPSGAVCKVSLVKGKTNTLVSSSVVALHTADGALIGINKFEQVLAGDYQFMYTSRTLLPADGDMYLRVSCGNILHYVPIQIGTLTLELSAEEVEIGYQGGLTAPVTIHTNDPNGWTAERVHDFTNIISSVTPSHGVSGGTVSAAVNLWDNVAGDFRTSHIRVSTANGVMSKLITVKQTVYPDVQIRGALEMAHTPEGIFPANFYSYALRFNFELVENLYLIVYYRNAFYDDSNEDPNWRGTFYSKMAAWNVETSEWDLISQHPQSYDIKLAPDGYYYFGHTFTSSWGNHFTHGNWVMIRYYLSKSDWLFDRNNLSGDEQNMRGKAYPSSLVDEIRDIRYDFPYEPRL